MCTPYMPFRPRMVGVHNYFCKFIFSRETFLRYSHIRIKAVIDRVIGVTREDIVRRFSCKDNVQLTPVVCHSRV